jgi:hypothetical protein
VQTVTKGVHFFKCSFLGNDGKIPINGKPVNAAREIFAFLRATVIAELPLINVDLMGTLQYRSKHRLTETLL